MSMFKEKNKKTFVGDNRITLDAKHNEMSKHFKDLRKSLPSKEKELKILKTKYNELKNIPNKDMTDAMIDEKYSLADSISEIESIINNNDELDYFLNTSHILYQYYDNIESIAQSKTEQKNTSVMDFFSTKPAEPEKKPDDAPKNMSDFVTTTKNFQRADMLSNYLKIVDPEYIGKLEYDKHYDKCSNCNTEKILMQDEGTMICVYCGQTDFVIIDSDKPSYKDPPPEVSYFAYKRSNHFNEWLSNVQGRESVQMPQEVYDKVLMEVKKERMTNLSKLTHDKTREYLKKLGYNKYYEHIPHIIFKLNGKPPLKINPDIEEKLRNMFKEIQEPFIKVCPTTRNNFLSYSYILYKFTELLELDELKSHFTLLKNREKLHQQDKIWQAICKELRWEFIKSV